MVNIEFLLLCVIILAIIIRLLIKPSDKKVYFENGSQIPYSKNPSPPPLRKSINQNTMSYTNSKDRVAALEALSRAYNSIATAPNIDDTMLEIVKSIKAEIVLIDEGRKNNF